MNTKTLIKKRREELGFTQEELGNRIGVKAAMVSHLETGKRKVSPILARSIETVLGIPKEQLVPEVFG